MHACVGHLNMHHFLQSCMFINCHIKSPFYIQNPAACKDSIYTFCIAIKATPQMHTYKKRLKNYKYPEMLSFFALLNDHLSEQKIKMSTTHRYSFIKR